VHNQLSEFLCDAVQDHFQFAHQIIFNGQPCGPHCGNGVSAKEAGISRRPADPMLQLAFHPAQLVYQAVALCRRCSGPSWESKHHCSGNIEGARRPARHDFSRSVEMVNERRALSMD
jgi:hypothetical protein